MRSSFFLFYFCCDNNWPCESQPKELLNPLLDFTIGVEVLDGIDVTLQNLVASSVGRLHLVLAPWVEVGKVLLGARLHCLSIRLCGLKTFWAPRKSWISFGRLEKVQLVSKIRQSSISFVTRKRTNQRFGLLVLHHLPLQLRHIQLAIRIEGFHPTAGSDHKIFKVLKVLLLGLSKS